MGLFSKKKKENFEFSPFTEGKVINLEEVPDQVFAQKMMGDGIAIEPTSSTIVAPCDGEITVVFPTGHAYGITRADGVEVLVHLGIDTVEMNGAGFSTKVAMGDHVQRGDLLCEMDLEAVKAAGKSIISPMIITSGQAVTLKRANELVAPADTDVFEVQI